jgi:hypothetical protein
MRTWIILSLLVGCTDGSSKDSNSDADRDHDGYTSDDCDEGNPDINPGAVEFYYDGVDQNCDQLSDFDQDQDGEDSMDYGGPDCDDTDASVNTSAEEVADDKDNNCDGSVGTVTVALTEVMSDPQAVDDAVGKWIELYNYGDTTVDLAGWYLLNARMEQAHLEGVTIEPGERRILGASDDTTTNGGAPVSWTWTAPFDIFTLDSLSLESPTGSVAFSVDWRLPGFPSAPGTALALSGDHDPATASEPGDWCLAATPYGEGDLGSPGVANEVCVGSDPDGDGYSSADGDCDESRPDAYPGAPEQANGRDDDCDGVIDNLAIADLAQIYWTGGPGDRLGTSLGLGDVRGDTLAEPLLGSELTGGGLGAVRGVILSAGSWGDADFVSLVGGAAGGRVGAVSPEAGDQDGDGIVDLVGAGVDPSGTRNTVVLTMLPGGSFLAGEKTMGAGVINLAGASGSNSARVYSALDLDGDGLDDILYGDPTSSVPTYQSGKVSLIYTADIQGPSMYGASFVAEFTGRHGNDFVGMGLGGADVNGDGYDDAFVGSPGDEPDESYVDSGSWTIYAGGAAPVDGTLGTGALARITVAEDRTGLGWGTPTFADMDGDGSQDLAFGGYGSDRVWVYLNASFSGGATYDATTSASFVVTGTENFGFSVSAGDYNNDGIGDLAVGAPAVDGNTPGPGWELLPGTAAGAAYLFLGPVAAGDQATASATIVGSPGDLFGAVMSVSDKVTSDDFADVLIGAPNAGSGGEGTAYLYSGRPTN